MGYRCKRHTKGIYYDGHECKDVVVHRKEFIREISESAL
jgi:hypothetical protein